MANADSRRLADRYEVRSLIGRGGMAQVHLGFDTRLSRVVAIKMLRPDLARDPIFQTRFRREAQAAASLNHPNIVGVYDTGEERMVGADGRELAVPYIVMEYVEGHTVKELLSDGTPVPIDEAVEITAGVLSALEYSHAAGLVHRDIKPGNVMLTPEGKVKVMDFGIARAMSDSQATMTQTNAVVGTAQYLSPEQAKGEQVDSRSDIYSTGCFLFELLTGRAPFQGDSAVAVAYQHVSEIPPAPSSLASDVPEALDRVTMKAMAKDPAERYPTAALMRIDMVRAVDGGAVDAPSTASWTSVTAATTPLGPAATATQVYQGPTRAGAATPPTPGDGTDLEQKKRSSKPFWIAALLIVALALVGTVIWIIWQSGRDPQMVAVPEVIGKTAEQAEQLIVDAEFEFKLGEPVPSTEVEEGLVALVDPEQGTEAPKGSVVTVSLSSGPQSVDVPQVLKMTEQEAKTAIEAAGLVFKLGEPISSTEIEKDRVAQVNPAEGSSVAEGSTVEVRLSSGPDDVVIPDMRGLNQDQVRAELARLGLEIGPISEDDSPEQAAGGLVLTEPAIGQTVPVGTSVSLVFASGNVNIPTNLAGQSRDDVVNILVGLRLQTVTREEQSASVPAGAVIRVEPTGLVPQGSGVTVVVSSGAPTPPQSGS